MPALNRVQIIGRLGKDPEARFTPAGKKSPAFQSPSAGAGIAPRGKREKPPSGLTLRHGAPGRNL